MNINKCVMVTKRKRSKATVVWGSCFDGEIAIPANRPCGTALRIRKKDIPANITSGINQ